MPGLRGPGGRVLAAPRRHAPPRLTTPCHDGPAWRLGASRPVRGGQVGAESGSSDAVLSSYYGEIPCAGHRRPIRRNRLAEE